MAQLTREQIVEKITEVLFLLETDMTETAKRILRQLRDFGVQAGPAHEEEEVAPGNGDEGPDCLLMRAGGPLPLRR